MALLQVFHQVADYERVLVACAQADQLLRTLGSFKESEALKIFENSGAILKDIVHAAIVLPENVVLSEAEQEIDQFEIEHEAKTTNLAKLLLNIGVTEYSIKILELVIAMLLSFNHDSKRLRRIFPTIFNVVV
jgi:hypothetical protein